jgi:glycogen phosphorylase
LNDPKAPSDWFKVDGVDALVELALNLHWSWNHAADELWEALDKDLWATTQNPWVILRTVSREKIKAALGAPEFRQKLDSLLQQNRDSYQADAWFQHKHPDAALTRRLLQHGVHAERSAAYLLGRTWQRSRRPDEGGERPGCSGRRSRLALRAGIFPPGLRFGRPAAGTLSSQRSGAVAHPAAATAKWRVVTVADSTSRLKDLASLLGGVVGRAKLYLLDTNDFANTAAHRGITSELYGGDAEMRLKQEIVLGIGGWRLLRALGLTPEVCHLNEGHAAFAVLERARSYMEDHKKPFDLAMNITRAGNLFTTHTAVSAGFDRFDPALIRTYLSHYAVDELAISVDDLLAMGRQNPEDNSEPFNMAYLAVRGSGQINGVSKLHGK